MNKQIAAPFLVMASGLLATAFLVQAFLADAHNVSISEVPHHTTVPVAVPVFVGATLLLTLWPVAKNCWVSLRRHRFNSGLLVLLAVLVLFVTDRALTAGALALAFACYSSWRARRPTSRAFMEESE